MGPAVRFCEVGYWRAAPKHARARRTRNEALNRLVEFSDLFRSMPRGGDGSVGAAGTQGHRALDGISVEIPRGSVVVVADGDGTSRFVLLRLAGRLESPRAGHICYGGTVLGLDGTNTMPLTFATVAQNLRLHAAMAGLRRGKTAAAIDEIRSIPGMAALLDLPANRVPKSSLVDLQLSAACALPADIVAISDLRRPSTVILDRWLGFLDQASAREVTVLMTARNLVPILPWATHLLLVENGRLRAFGQADVVAQEHAQFLHRAQSVSAINSLIENNGEASIPREFEGDDYAALRGPVSGASDAGSSIVIAQPSSESSGTAVRPGARPAVQIEHPVEIGVRVSASGARACVRPHLDLWWKGTLQVARVPGPEILFTEGDTACCKVVLPACTLTPAKWSIRLSVREIANGSDRLVGISDMVAVSSEVHRDRVPRKWRGVIAPWLESPDLDTSWSPHDVVDRKIDISPVGGHSDDVITQEDAIEIRAVCPDIDIDGRATIRVDLVHGHRTLTSTPDAQVSLQRGQVLRLTARIPARTLMPGDYQVRICRRGSGPMHPNDPPVRLIEAPLRVSSDPEKPLEDIGMLSLELPWQISYEPTAGKMH